MINTLVSVSEYHFDIDVYVSVSAISDPKKSLQTPKLTNPGFSTLFVSIYFEFESSLASHQERVSGYRTIR